VQFRGAWQVFASSYGQEPAIGYQQAAVAENPFNNNRQAIFLKSSIRN
jgi:hypothetical protein